MRSEETETGSRADTEGVPGSRFGERLRRQVPEWETTLRAIAAAIDQDAKIDKEALRDYVLGQVREAVERLRYAVVYPGNDTPARGLSAKDVRVDVVNAENLLAELAKIFGAPNG